MADMEREGSDAPAPPPSFRHWFMKLTQLSTSRKLR